MIGGWLFNSREEKIGPTPVYGFDVRGNGREWLARARIKHFPYVVSQLRRRAQLRIKHLARRVAVSALAVYGQCGGDDGGNLAGTSDTQ